MKNIIVVFMSVVLFLAVSDRAFAKDFWLSDSSGNEKYIFKKNEIPWIHVELKNNDTSILGWWGYGGNKNTIFEEGFPRKSTVSRDLKNWNWPILQKENSYNVHINGYGTLHACVTPEPVSAALFAIGAGVLGMMKRYKNGS